LEGYAESQPESQEEDDEGVFLGIVQYCTSLSQTHFQSKFFLFACD
jgi:hypothetical protein